VLVYVTDYSGFVHCLDAHTGQSHWKHKTGSPIWSSTLAAQNTLFVGTEDRDFWILQAGDTLKILNKIRFPHKIYNSAVIANDVMYIATERYLYSIGTGRQ
jgi:outer membrane protein assembly factor BamB